MKLYFYRGKYPNFGDELNTWLMPKVFPNFFDNNDKVLFLGIGSIILDTVPKDAQKIVFGSGYGGYSAVPDLDEKWTFYGVRGPHTASICGLSPEQVSGDSAILINRYRKIVPPAAKRRIIFMPHWQSLGLGHWQDACRLAGIDFIDPRRPVDEILDEIQSSSMIITEAMHGAIVADALRIPWIAVSPIDKGHRSKWFDWAEALDIKLAPQRLWPSSLQEAFVGIMHRHSNKLKKPRGPFGIAVKCVNKVMVLIAAARLRFLSYKKPSLSSDIAINRVVTNLAGYAEQIKKDFKPSFSINISANQSRDKYEKNITNRL